VLAARPSHDPLSVKRLLPGCNSMNSTRIITVLDPWRPKAVRTEVMDTDRDEVEELPQHADKPEHSDAISRKVVLELVVCVEALAGESALAEELLGSEPFTRMRELYKQLRRKR